MKTRTGQILKKNEQGTAIVEAAIILLAFFLCIFGVFEAGRFMNTQQILTNAAREGARMAVAPLTGTNTLPSTNEVIARVNLFLASANISGATVSVSPVVVNTGTVNTTYTQVLVQDPYQILTLPVQFNMLSITLHGEALMRNETSD